MRESYPDTRRIQAPEKVPEGVRQDEYFPESARGKIYPSKKESGRKSIGWLWVLPLIFVGIVGVLWADNRFGVEQEGAFKTWLQKSSLVPPWGKFVCPVLWQPSIPTAARFGCLGKISSRDLYTFPIDDWLENDQYGHSPLNYIVDGRQYNELPPETKNILFRRQFLTKADAKGATALLVAASHGRLSDLPFDELQQLSRDEMTQAGRVGGLYSTVLIEAAKNQEIRLLPLHRLKAGDFLYRMGKQSKNPALSFIVNDPELVGVVFSGSNWVGRLKEMELLLKYTKMHHEWLFTKKIFQTYIREQKEFARWKKTKKDK